MCWLYSAFLDVIWVRFYFSVWSERPKGERAHFTLGLVLYLTMFVVAFSSPYLVIYYCFLVTNVLGRVVVVYLLATIQHRKGHEQRVDPMAYFSTNVNSQWWQHLFILDRLNI